MKDDFSNLGASNNKEYPLARLCSAHIFGYGKMLLYTSHGPHSWIQVFPPLVLALDAGELPKKFSVTSASTQKIAEVIKNLA